MTASELLLIIWFGVSVGCILVAWIKGHWIAGVVVAIICLATGYVMGVIK